MEHRGCPVHLQIKPWSGTLFPVSATGCHYTPPPAMCIMQPRGHVEVHTPLKLTFNAAAELLHSLRLLGEASGVQLV